MNAVVEAYAERIVAAAPPLTPAQVNRIIAAIRPHRALTNGAS